MKVIAYRSHKSELFSIAIHFVVTEYAYSILDKGLVKYWPIFKMTAILNLYRQMLTGRVTGACCFDETGRDNN